jgi:hypothetical protein
MSTALSSGSPTRSVSIRALSLATSARPPLLHQDPRAGAADLALVEPDRVHHALDHAVEIGVGKTTKGDLPPSSSESFLPLPAVAGG